MTGFGNISRHNLDVPVGVLGVGEIAFVEDRQKRLLEELTVGVERYKWFLAGRAGYLSEAAVREAVYFLITRDSYVRKAV